MNYHTSFARVCTITTLLSCLIVPRLVYAGWPMVKYKNGTVGILNDDGDVHVQNTNLFVYGKKVVHPEKCVPPGGRRQYFNGTEWMCVCEDGWSGLTCEIEKTLSMYFHEDVMQEGDTWVPCTNHQHEVSNGGYLWVSSELCARITSVLNEKVNSASMSSAGYSYTCGGQGGKYEDHANHFGYGDGTPGNGNTNVRIGSQLLEEASGVAFNDGNCCGIFGMENCHINATLVPKFEAFIASLFLLGKKVTPIPDASWHAYVAECLAEAPVTGECKKWASGNNYGTMPNWDVSQVVNMAGNKCTDADGDGNWDCILVGFVNTAFNGNVSRWDTSSVYYMHDMFRDAYAFNQPIGGWNLSNVNQIQNMFNGASAFNQPLHGWDVSNVYSMNGLFYGAASFNHPIESWNVSGVTEMEEMFEDAQSFNQPLGLWDVSSVTTMKDMFEGAISFNSPIDSASSSYYGWETSQVTSMEDMFKGALLFNQYIGALNVSRVQSMESMFEDAHTFDQPIRDWDVASVTSMEDMFQRAYSFNRPIGNWNTSSVTNMDQMFDDASTFEQDVSQWKGPAATSVATDRNMFYGATAFLAEFSCSVHGPASACLRKDTGPPKCVAPGGDKLQHNGTNWICVCVENWSGETCESPPSTSVTPIAAGSEHACAILDDKSVKCWGRNKGIDYKGQLGLGDTNNRGDASGEMGDNLPAVDLGTGRTATAISSMGHHTCALLDDKSVKCWGNNRYGELGLGDTNHRGDASGEMGDNLPAVDLGTGRSATAIFAMGASTCALLDDKSLKCWGINDSGELGLGDTNNRGDASGEMGDNLPAVDLGIGRTATVISAQQQHVCALLDDKSLKCWGLNDSGQLGLGDAYNRGDASGEMGDNLPAVDLGTGRTATAIAAGDHHTCALLDDKSLKCWGNNRYGQLGLGDTNNRGDASGEMGDNLPAVDLGTGRSATAILSGGWMHMCALLDDKSLKCWGNNDKGQLGLGDTNNRGDASGEMGDNLPAVDLGTGRSATAIAAGRQYTCALLDDKSLKCWGQNGYGTLGLGDTIDRGTGYRDDMGDNLPAVDLGTGFR